MAHSGLEYAASSSKAGHESHIQWYDFVFFIQNNQQFDSIFYSLDISSNCTNLSIRKSAYLMNPKSVKWTPSTVPS